MKLKETVEMYYDSEGKLKTLDKIKDIQGAIDYYEDVLLQRVKPSNKNFNYSDRREYFYFRDQLKKLKKHLKSK